MDAYQQMSQTKDSLQQAFRTAWNQAKRRGAAGAATGVGKTKPAIDEMMDLWDAYIFEREPRFIETGIHIKPRKVFVVVPTEEMRDTNWPAEAERWYGENGLLMWKESVTCVCYISMHKYRASDFDLVVLDECHHLTALSATFFNAPVDVMALSATYPDFKRDPDKWTRLNQIAPLVFTYLLDQGVEDGVVSPFEFHVVRVPLDNIHKNIEAGPKARRYQTTEAARYNVLSNTIRKMYANRQQNQAEMMVMKRKLFIYGLPSKEKVAKALIEKLCDLPTWETEYDRYGFRSQLLTGHVRTLIFFGSIKQADELMGERVYHLQTKGKRKVRRAPWTSSGR